MFKRIWSLSLALKKKKTADPAFGSALQIWVVARH